MGTVSVSSAAEEAALQRVIASKIFSRNPRLSALLEYLCRKSLGSVKGSIKEYDIATDVFHRPPDFDQTTDAIVRVEMHRLRKKLKEYYSTEGADDTLEISLQAGRYAPEFLNRGLPAEVAFEPVETAVFTVAADERSPDKGSRIAAVAAVLILLVIGGGLLWSRRPKQIPDVVAPPVVAAPPAGHAPPVEKAPVAAMPPAGEAVRVLCGSAEDGLRDREGNTWRADAFYAGGTPVKSASQPIYRSRDAMLFRTARSGEFGYRIPLKPGIYELHLYFADTVYRPGMDMEGGEGTRNFNVRLNGAFLLRDFDIISEVGPSTADTKVFKDIQPAADGNLHLDFTRQVGEPILNAIEILPGLPHRTHPIRIVAQDRAFSDRAGLSWEPDNYFLFGRASSRFGTMSGPSDPQIYERERYGHFSYAIPVAGGSRYTVNLHFGESFWGPEQVGGGGVGSRVFDVDCNGVALLKNFDMFKEAGANRQIVKTFHGLRANAQGTLLFSFIPIKNYASFSALEVLDESK